MSDSLSATSIRIVGHRDDKIEAYLAKPTGQATRGGVVVIHHMPGYDRSTKEIVRRFAEIGYDSICPNLYSREAPGALPEAAAAIVRANKGVPDDQVVGDVAGAANYLRSLDTSNSKVAVVGYCSGGRHSVLAACNVDFTAAVDCYGGLVTGIRPDGYPLNVDNIEDQLPGLRCPLLGLFGQHDSRPSPLDVAELDDILTASKKAHEFHMYADAGHAFFAVDRPHFNVEAANDGWIRVADFLGRYL
jgi:carboxymethylenebutenolidase